jgi:hypothetical protein
MKRADETVTAFTMRRLREAKPILAEFDDMCELFTSYAITVADWKHRYAGAAYSTRLKAAIADMKFAIAEAEKHPEIAPPAQAGADVRDGADNAIACDAMADARLVAAYRSGADAVREALERVLLDIDFMVERGVIPAGIRHDMIYTRARAALALIEHPGDKS